MRPLVAKWRGEGKKVIMFLDDGFGCGDTRSNTNVLSNEVEQDLLDSGFIPKADKSLWIPVQELQWLGAIINSLEFTIRVPQHRIDKDLVTIWH